MFKFVIRLYHANDYSSVKSNLEQTEMFDSVWDSQESLNRMIQQDQRSIWVATVNREVVGSVYAHSVGFWAHVWRLNVREEFTQLGIGSALLEAAELKFKDQGIPEAALYYSAKNPELETFYAKRGWKKIEGFCGGSMYKEL